MRKLLCILGEFLKVVVSLVIVVAILVGTFGAGYFLGYRAGKDPGAVVEAATDSFDLELPLEVERRAVTVDEVKSKLVSIGELSTYSGEYECTLGKEETRYFLEKIPVLFSTNSVELTCNGIVKVGYDLADFVVKVDDDKIYISLPEVQLNDNYVIWESVQCSERNCILNPIEFSQYEELVAEIEQKGLEDVTARGIYQEAEDNLKFVIENFLSEFNGYEIIYM